MALEKKTKNKKKTIFSSFNTIQGDIFTFTVRQMLAGISLKQL